MVGRRPKPTAAKELAGNPGKRALKKEPTPKIGPAPAPPSWLGRFGTKLWRDYAPKLVTLGLLSEVDTVAWEALCHAYDRMREASQDIKRKGSEGRVYVKDGIARLRPEVRIEAEARKEFRQFCAEFGLTPASRSRVAESAAGARQPELPMPLPDQRDPDKSLNMPMEGGWNDEHFFGTAGTRH